jgi:LDH2 family malate/lactate/ureidoglycolate dehydrogenase
MTEIELLDLATRALQSFGVPPKHAAKAARILVLADMFGISTHGVSRISSYGERIRLGGIAAQPNIVRQQVAPTMSMIDGDNGLGPLVGHETLDAALELARETGMAAVFARGSNHFGPVSPYAYLAAQEGFASIIGSNATTTIAPWGGREARLGNNPLGFGIPNPGGRPVILDMAISVAARAKIRQALDRGETIPLGWAADSGGMPTTDPRAALDGFLLPIGGHKGYGLALIVDLFAGLLSGAAYLTHVTSWVDSPSEPQNLGHFVILLDIRRLGPSDQLAGRMADFAAILHETPPADSGKPVLLPGEIEMRNFERQSAEGLGLPTKVIAELQAFAAHHH